MEEGRQANAAQQQPPIAVFVRDGKSYVKLIQAAPGKASSGAAPVRFVTASTARIVKQATVGVNGNKGAQATQGVTARAVGSVSNSNKISPWKPEPTILPKPVHVTTAPMILAAPPRLVGVPASPRIRPASGTSVGDQAGWSGKATLDYSESDFSDSGKRVKKGEKGGKGLRHFSMKVCEKVQKKGVTSYNEVADELVAEFSDPGRSASPTDQAYDQKNIRRRVYDALNVLMAMNIISKEKKEIRWLGLPTNSAQECQNLEVEKFKRLERIKIKRQQLNELILQQIAFKSLVERNKQVEKSYGVPNPNSAIQLPFIIVNTSKKTIIDCSISNDKMEYLFNFDNTFEIHDDIEILKRMGMTCGLEKGECSTDDLEKVKLMVPRALTCYVTQMAQENALLAVQEQDSRPETASSLSADSHDASGIASKRGISEKQIGFQNDDLVGDAGTWGSDMVDVAGAKGISRQSSVASEKSASLGGDDDDEMDDEEEEEDEDLFGASGGDSDDDDDMDQH